MRRTLHPVFPQGPSPSPPPALHTVRIVLIVLTLAVLTAAASFAQPQRGDGEKRRHARHPGSDPRLIEVLDLSESQQESWRAAHEAHRESTAALMERIRDNRDALEDAIEAEDALRVGELTLDGRALHEEARAGFEALQSELRAILDPSQVERWEAFQAARRDGGRRFGRGPRRGGPHGPGPGGSD